MRGQGIKIFSLVLKEARKAGCLIPVLKRDISIQKEDIQFFVKETKTVTKFETAVEEVIKKVRSYSNDLSVLKPSALSAAILYHIGESLDVSIPYSEAKKKYKYLTTVDFESAVTQLKNTIILAEADSVDTDAAALAQQAEGYEGAIVLNPESGIYIDDPVTVLDYASLYPSCILAKGLSHDRIIINKKYDNLPGIKYNTIEYDIFDKDKLKVGVRECRYAVLEEKGIIPKILEQLLGQRKATRKRMTTCENEFELAVLDGLQNAYKVTANSLYGQIGARTSQIYLKDIAACTTATGRSMIMQAKEFLETKHGAKIIYGDTDSIFAIFPNYDADGNILKGHASIMPSIIKAKQASSEFKQIIEKPHDLEYEKTFWPFILLSKKKYVGNLYEMDDKKYKQKSMGIVLKRRDNAQIVKKIFGGVIKIILEEHNVEKSINFMTDELLKMVKGQAPLEDLVVTKSLKSEYKDPTRIAHKVLADRIAEREPGNKPQSNDRIPYVYIVTDNSKALQGERIETPTFIINNKLVPDYGFYITNQIMKPLLQIFALIVEQLPGYSNAYSSNHLKMVQLNIENEFTDPDKIEDKMQTFKEYIAKTLLFDPVISQIADVKIKKSLIGKKYNSVLEDGTLPPKEKAKPKPRAKKDTTNPATPRKPRAKKDALITDFYKVVANTEATENDVNPSPSIPPLPVKKPRKPRAKKSDIKEENL
jgi:hypothetical protein